MKVVVVVAYEAITGAIGYKGNVFYHMKADMIHFRKITTKSLLGKENLLIMGRKTWDSLPNKPLQNRQNLVMTNRPILGIPTKQKVWDAFEYGLGHSEEIDNIFVIGGEVVYRDFLESDMVDEIVATVYYSKNPVEGDILKKADTFFPLEYLTKFKMVRKDFLAEDQNFTAYVCIYKKSAKTD